MRIEKVTEQDAAALLEIYAPYVEQTAISFEYEVPSLAEFKDRIRRISARYPYIKAVDADGKILGYAYAGEFKSRMAYSWDVETTIYIRQKERRRGIGGALYQALEQSLKKMGVCNMNACIAYTAAPDAHLTNDSMRFHDRMGFALVGTFHQCGYKFGHWYDMIWMEKLINPHESEQPPVQLGKWEI